MVGHLRPSSVTKGTGAIRILKHNEAGICADDDPHKRDQRTMGVVQAVSWPSSAAGDEDEGTVHKNNHPSKKKEAIWEKKEHN